MNEQYVEVLDVFYCVTHDGIACYDPGERETLCALYLYKPGACVLVPMFIEATT